MEIGKNSRDNDILQPAIDAEVNGSSGHPNEVFDTHRVSKFPRVSKWVSKLSSCIGVWYTDLHNNIIHCTHFGAFYWFVEDVFEVIFSACIIFWGISLICVHLDTL